MKVKQINNTTTKLCNQLQQTPVKCIVHKFIITIIYLANYLVHRTKLFHPQFVATRAVHACGPHLSDIWNTISIWRFNEIDAFIVSAESMKEVSTVYVYIS